VRVSATATAASHGGVVGIQARVPVSSKPELWLETRRGWENGTEQVRFCRATGFPLPTS
jgi:hypothetical protein